LEDDVVLSSTDDFQIQWADPEDAERTWNWDQAHAPRPLSPLAGDIANLIHGNRRRVSVNGYTFNAVQPRAPGGARPAGNTPEAWFSELLPQIRASCARIRDLDFAAMSIAEVAAALDGLLTELTDNYLTSLSVAFRGAGMPIEDFFEFCREHLGADAELLAATMLQGVDNESAASGLALNRVSDLAASLPEVVMLLRDERYDEIESANGGPEFLKGYAAYLDDYGWRAESFNNLHLPTWAEDPRAGLALVRRYLIEPERSPRAAWHRAQELRQKTVREIESRLNVPELVQRFRELLQRAEQYVPINESRAHWQLVSAGLSRRPVIALGDKLAAEGILPRPDDVFFLSYEELKELLAQEPMRPVPPALIEQRRADLMRWERLIPPRFLGRPPATAGAIETDSPFDPRIVSGTPASAGSVRGRARIVMTLPDSAKVEPGDVLVCPATAPTWMPLFSIVSAVVADSGGILSHCAIAAREYALPCVVGTLTGTQRIPDGALVTVDGARGIVRIED
jgi:pyruvate,water dikinase